MKVVVARKLFLVVATCLLSATRAEGTVIATETVQSSAAMICIGDCVGANRSDVLFGTFNGTAHANNFDGNLMSPSEARTAARSSASEIAANASLRHRTGRPFRDYSSVAGLAEYVIDAMALNSGNVFLEFYLPPGFVEIEANAEFRDSIQLSSYISANISMCSPACGTPGETLFEVTSELRGGWETHELINNAVSPADPSLDTSSLTHDNVTVVESDGNFIRTKTWEYGGFSARLPLGHFNAGDDFSVSYLMFARVSASDARFRNWAAAAINDPFFLSSDPLPQRPIFVFTQVPIPEPTALVLVLISGLVMGSRTQVDRRPF